MGMMQIIAVLCLKERKGFFADLSPGLCYRNSISATLSALPRTDDKASTVTSNSEKGGGGGGSGTEDCSIGSAGSLAKRNQHNTQGLPWDDEDVESGKSVNSFRPDATNLLLSLIHSQLNVHVISAHLHKTFLSTELTSFCCLYIPLSVESQ
jgi:hypothetical protein